MIGATATSNLNNGGELLSNSGSHTRPSPGWYLIFRTYDPSCSFVAITSSPSGLDAIATRVPEALSRIMSISALALAAIWERNREGVVIWNARELEAGGAVMIGNVPKRRAQPLSRDKPTASSDGGTCKNIVNVRSSYFISFFLLTWT